MKILVTGAAGFIGYHLCNHLVQNGHEVVGLDNINDYYDVNLKTARLKNLGLPVEADFSFNQIINSQTYHNRLRFIRLNIEDRENLSILFEAEKFDQVCNLAAQPGVRYSLENPMAYIQSNIVGFANILECCRNFTVKKLVYASSSSVYGLNDTVPFSVADNVDHPASLYAATKKSNELMAHSYSHLYNIQTVGLRFFTVYGPWGRPDMAMFLFTDAILKNKPIKIFNNGDLSRDFTYIDDIIQGVAAVIENESNAQYKVYNIGNSKPVKLMDFVTAIEGSLNLTAKKEMLPMQPGDVLQTWADVSELISDYGYKPNTGVDVGVAEFVAWYKTYYNLKD
ncbi:MAG: NAD-dependent epimerase [Bacteroidota bacterium]